MTDKPISLSANEYRLLLDIYNGLPYSSEEGLWCYGFKTIGGVTSIPEKLVRRTTRALARKGLMEFARGLMDENGQVCGAGYGITEKGRKLAEELLSCQR